MRAHANRSCIFATRLIIYISVCAPINTVSRAVRTEPRISLLYQVQMNPEILGRRRLAYLRIALGLTRKDTSEENKSAILPCNQTGSARSEPSCKDESSRHKCVNTVSQTLNDNRSASVFCASDWCARRKSFLQLSQHRDV